MNNQYFTGWAANQGLRVISERQVGEADKDGAKYFIVEVGDDESGGEALFSLQEGSEPTLLALENSIDLVPFGLEAPIAQTQNEFFGLFDAEPARPPFPEGSRGAEKLHLASLHYVGKLVSKNAPDTNNGRLACAWAVNYITKVCVQHNAGGGLQTAAMFQALKQDPRWQRLGADAAINDGDLVISPTGGIHGTATGIGHVGFISAAGLIRSNSSNAGVWQQNYNRVTWEARYRLLGVAFFRYVG